MKKHLLFLFAALLPLVVSAQTKVEIYGIWYKLDANAKQAKVTFKGGYSSEYDEYSGFIYIPPTVTYKGVAYSVTGIGGSAFEDCNRITDITIPESVTRIESRAFLGCSSLASIDVAEGNKVYDSRNGCNAIIETSSNTLIQGCSATIIPESVTSIGNSAFSGCSSLTAITFPEGVTSIGSNAFYGCSSLTAITFPEGVTSIGSNVLADCSSLTAIEVAEGNKVYDSRNGCNAIIETSSNTLIQGCSATIIPESVTSIGDCAFYECSNLTAITFPEGVTSIGYGAFYECSSLTAINIPESVTSIGNCAFYECSSLTAITIPESVTSIGDCAFYECTSLNEVVFEDGVTTLSLGCNYRDTYYGGEGLFYDCPLEKVYLGRNLSYNEDYSYGYSPFYNKVTLISLAIGDNVDSIGNCAFKGCIGLTAISLPENVTSIGYDAFRGCSNLTSISIFEGVISIGGFAFYECVSLTSIIIPESVTSIADYAFKGCSNLSSITIPRGVTTIGRNAFTGCTGELTIHCNIPSASYSNESPFYGSKFTKITIDGGVTSIGNYAFYNCTSLKEVIIEDGSKRLSLGYNEYSYSDGEGIFYDCPLEKVYLGRYLSYSTRGSCGYSPFYNKSMLTSLIIGDSVTSIGSNAFYGCSGLTSVTIPENVTSIAQDVFDNCTSLKEVIIEDGNSPLSFYDRVSQGAFYGCPLETIYLGRDLLHANRGLLPFYDKETITSVTIGENVTSIGESAFSGCKGLTSITLPEGVTTIGSSAFSGCSSLTAITIPESSKLTSIGDYVFFGSSIATITIPKSVTEIGDHAFIGCDSLENITLNCANIKKWFAGFTSIKEVVLGENVTKIGNEAFQYCSSITSITIPEKVRSIGEYAFYDCASLANVTSRIPAEHLFGISNTVFEGIPTDAVLHVSGGDVLAYKSTPGWDRFGANIEYHDYCLSYVIDGEVYSTMYLDAGEEIQVIDSPVKEGYTFGGWSEIPETMPASDVVICGTFIVNKYLVTFKIGDEVIAADSLEYGSVIVAPEASEREGYTFDGWGEVAETIPAHDVTYEGSYTANIYKVYYYVGDELVHTAEVAYGEAIPEYVYEPTAEGDVFVGWVGETYETMPAHDVTYTANIESGINQLLLDNGQLTIYDLMGRKVTDIENLKGGVYIINGRKLVVK